MCRVVGGPTVSVIVRKNGWAWNARVELRGNAEFFDDLALDGRERVLAGLDVAAGRQPQARQPVIAEQHAPGLPVDGQEVRHQMR